MSDYNTTQSEYREMCKARIQRQLEIGMILCTTVIFNCAHYYSVVASFVIVKDSQEKTIALKTILTILAFRLQKHHNNDSTMLKTQTLQCLKKNQIGKFGLFSF